MPNLSELVGKVKTGSDIRSVPFKLRFLQAPTVGPATNGPVRMTLPKSGAGYMDVSSLRWRGLLNVTTTDSTARLAGHDLSVLIARVRVLNGNRVIYDQEANPLISNFTTLINVDDNSYLNQERKLSDYPVEANTATRTSQVTTAHTANRLCVSTLGPAGGFLNGKHLIPLENSRSPIHIDLWFAEASVAFLSVDDADLQYSLTDFSLQWHSLYSSSLDAHYGQGPVNIHCTEFGHRYNHIAAGTSSINLLIPSHHSNCSGIVTMFREQSTVNDITEETLENCSAVFADDLESFDYRIATRSVYSEPLNDVHEYYEELRHLFPRISTSRYFTAEGFENGQFVHAVNLSGGPAQFGGAGQDGMLTSGVKSSSLVTDMSMKLNFAAPTEHAIEASHFVLSDVVYSFRGGMIDVTL
jgi:hypothetical protein